MNQTPTLDDRQARVFEALRERSPKLAGVYLAAIGSLAHLPLDRGEAARVSAIAHHMRELMANLPAAMTDHVIPRPKPSSGALTAKLPDLLAEADLDLDSDQDLIPVPKKAAKAISELLSALAKEQGRNRSNAAELITAGSDVDHPAITEWNKTYQYFVGWAHLDRNHEERELPSDDDLLTKIRVVEDVIEVRTALFFENLHSIEDILAEANAVQSGEVAS